MKENIKQSASAFPGKCKRTNGVKKIELSLKLHFLFPYTDMYIVCKCVYVCMCIQENLRASVISAEDKGSLGGEGAEETTLVLSRPATFQQV